MYYGQWEEESRKTCTILNAALIRALDDQERAYLRGIAAEHVRKLQGLVDSHEASELAPVAMLAMCQITDRRAPAEELACALQTLSLLAQGQLCNSQNVRRTLQHFSVFHHVVDGMTR